MINKLFHMIEKKHSYDQISSESESYLSILMLIAKHKCALPPQQENAQEFVRNLLKLFFESLSKTTNNQHSTLDNYQINQQIRLALDNCAEPNEYDFHLNDDDDDNDKLFCNEDNDDVYRNVESTNDNVNNNCPTNTNHHSPDSTLANDDDQTLLPKSSIIEKPIHPSSSSSSDATFIADNNQTIIQRKPIENGNKCSNDNQKHENENSPLESSLLLTPQIDTTNHRLRSAVMPKFSVISSTPMIENERLNFNSFSRISNFCDKLSTDISNSFDATLMAKNDSVNEELTIISLENDNHNNVFNAKKQSQSIKSKNHGQLKKTIVNGDISNHQNTVKMKKKKAPSSTTLKNNTINNHNNNNDTTTNETFHTATSRTLFTTNTSCLNDSYRLRARTKKINYKY
ncbi:hypothetical protein HUG17_0907 [Dermatophagoides farinae]|nr:hypothetical protein HUG17_0907 [Dermatophagoides farinae]